MSQEINIVEQIKDRAEIIETVGRLVPLRRSGKSWSGLCPFHSEKTASFHVYEDSGSYYCYGCGAHGDIITFYQNYYHLDFNDSCERLCKENGIDWKPGGSFNADNSREPLYEVNRFAGSLYYEAVKKENNPALNYLLGRGMDRKTISKFRLGYADSSERMLSDALANDKSLLEAADETGLIYKYGGFYRDRFFGRVMFPIVNTRGKVIGFGGRDIDGKAKAKYINSAASKVYDKGSNLYGLNISHSEIRRTGFAILVEGYMDMVALYKHGVTNVCAQLGTAFTQRQAKLLGRYTKSVVIALDSDESGQTAALRTMDILNEAGLKVRVLVPEAAKDPDDFLRLFGKDAWDAEVDNAKPMFDFKIERMKKGYDLKASDGMADFLKEAAKLIASMSPVEQDHYIKKLSSETGISESAIAMQAQIGKRETQIRPVRRDKPAEKTDTSDNLYCSIIGLMIGSEEALVKAAAYRHMFVGTDFAGVMNSILAWYDRTGSAPTASELAEMLDEADLAVLDLAVRKAAFKQDGEYKEQIQEYLIKLEIETLKEKERILKESAALNSGETDAAMLKELTDLLNRIKKLEGVIRKGKRGE